MSAVQKYLTQYLLQCSKLENIAESIRQSLAKNPYFQIVSTFERLDKFKKGYLEPADFSQFMLENQVYPTEGELYLIFKDFDRQKKGVVSLQQLQAELLPRDNKLLNKKVRQRLAYPVDTKLEMDLEFLLAKYFQDKINTFGILGELREKMKLIRPDAIEVAFAFLDTRRARYLSSPSQIDDFLRSNGKVLKVQQLEKIFRVLKFNEDREISMELFLQHLDPFGSGCYPAYKQKMIEKQTLQQRFLEKKYEVENLRSRNRIQNDQLRYEITELRNSNRRLRQIMDEQDLEGYYEQKRWTPY